MPKFRVLISRPAFVSEDPLKVIAHAKEEADHHNEVVVVEYNGPDSYYQWTPYRWVYPGGSVSIDAPKKKPVPRNESDIIAAQLKENLDAMLQWQRDTVDDLHATALELDRAYATIRELVNENEALRTGNLYCDE